MDPTGNITTILMNNDGKTPHPWPPTPSHVQQEVMQVHSVEPDRLYATVDGEHQRQDMELTQNQAYITSPNIPVQPNECYGTTTHPVGSDQLYATVVEGQHGMSF